MSRCCRGLGTLVSAFRDGSRVIGAGGVKYLTLHVDNPRGLVSHEKGEGIATLATTLVPEYVETQIYENIKKELEKQFKEKGSTVTVSITEVPPKGRPTISVTREGVFLGLLLAGLGYGAVKLVGRLV